MKTKILALSIVLILTITSFSSLASALETCGEETGPVADSDIVFVTKMIKDMDGWVKQIDASIDDILRFNISITYNYSEARAPAYMIRNIKIIDTLPDGLEYFGNATAEEVSNESNIITWDFGKDFHLNETYPTFSLEFDAKVVGYGTLVNKVDVSALEKCISVWRYVRTNATVFVSGGYDYRSKDVEPDENLEYAYDYNMDPSDGFESYVDPDDSSESILSVDGDNDSKIDHFINTNLGFVPLAPDKYWDPDDGILSNISIIDVDYDSTNEWVYDSDGDDVNDRFYDPDDGKIYPYEVYTLAVNNDGHGLVEKDPNGALFLTWKLHEVNLTAVPDEGYVFDHWSGDVSEENENINPLTITMDDNKAITAHFKTSKNDNNLTVEIIKPRENWVYKDNLPIRKKIFRNGTEITGPITVKVRAKSDVGIDRVEFYLNDELQKTAQIGLLNVYRWLWLKRVTDTDNYTIKVVAYDKEGNNKSAEIEVNRDRYKPIRDHPLITIGAVAGLLLLLKNRFKPSEEDTDDNGGDDNGGPNDGDNVVNDVPPEDETEKSEPKTGNVKEEGIDLFWYIVAGLAIILLVILGLLYMGGKMYE